MVPMDTNNRTLLGKGGKPKRAIKLKGIPPQLCGVWGKTAEKKAKNTTSPGHGGATTKKKGKKQGSVGRADFRKRTDTRSNKSAPFGGSARGEVIRTLKNKGWAGQEY